MFDGKRRSFRQIIPLVLGVMLCLALTQQPALASPLWEDLLMDQATRDTLKSVWDAQTFRDMQSGRIAIPDEAINAMLSSAAQDNPAWPEIRIAALDGNKLRIEYGPKQAVEAVMTADILELSHNRDRSVFSVAVTDKQYTGSNFLGGLLPRLSLAMVAKLFGPLPLSEGMTARFDGDTATVDYHQALYDSRWGQARLAGIRVLDMLTITGARARAGAVEIDIAFNLPPAAGDKIGQLLARYTGR